MIMRLKSKDKTVPNIFLNIGHLLDHFMMLIFAKAAYDSGRYFGLQFDEMIIYGTIGMILFGLTAPLAGFLSDKYGRMPLMIIYHFGLGISAILCSMASSPFQLAVCLGLIGLFASIYHPVGTCKMGNDELAVVDNKLKIKGLKNIRVSDASIMPKITSGNTNAPTIMIAEKCSSMIIKEYA